MIKNYNRLLTRIGGLTILLFVIFVLVACTRSNIGEVAETPKEQPETEQTEQTQLAIGNYYMAVTNENGSVDDGSYFAVGFMGYVEDKYFEELSDNYGYDHLNRVPVWADCGGDEMWVVIPKYEDSEIIVTATEDINLDSGVSYKAGDEIVRAEESLVVYSDSTEEQANIEINVKTIHSSYGFKPIVSISGDEIQLPSNIWNISEYEAQGQDEAGILGDWRWEGENGEGWKMTASEGDEAYGVEDGYTMVTESIYPEREPGFGGPFGGPLELDGNKASYYLDTSEGKITTNFEYEIEGDSLTFRFMSGDPYFSLRNVGDAITFKRVEYLNKDNSAGSTGPFVSIAYESYVETIGVNGIYTEDAPERVASVLGEPLEKPFGDSRYDYSYGDAAYSEKLMVVFADYGVKYIQATTTTEDGKLLSYDFLEEFQGKVYRATEELAQKMGVLSSFVFLANDDSVLIVEKRLDDNGEANRSYMVQSIYDWNASRAWSFETFADGNKFTEVDGPTAIEEQ